MEQRNNPQAWSGRGIAGNWVGVGSAASCAGRSDYSPCSACSRGYALASFVGRRCNMTKVDAVTLIKPRNGASETSPHVDLVWIPGGTFRKGSDRHYTEEAPVHRVTGGGFWIDRTPLTNLHFGEFVKATGHITFAEIAP